MSQLVEAECVVALATFPEHLRDPQTNLVIVIPPCRTRPPSADNSQPDSEGQMNIYERRLAEEMMAVYRSGVDRRRGPTESLHT